MGQASGKEDAKEVLQATGTIFSVLVIISAILIILSTIPYWIFIHKSVTGEFPTSATSIVLYVISPLVLLLISVCGFAGAIRWSERLLHLYGLVNIIMFVFGSIQLLLTYITYQDCVHNTDRFPSSPFKYICDPTLPAAWFWYPQLVLLFINVLAAFFAWGFTYKIQYANDPPIDAYD